MCWEMRGRSSLSIKMTLPIIGFYSQSKVLSLIARLEYVIAPESLGSVKNVL